MELTLYCLRPPLGTERVLCENMPWSPWNTFLGYLAQAAKFEIVDSTLSKYVRLIYIRFDVEV